ncbi:MAG: hypothetical protein FWG74_09710, partial [Planctomycetes bacterium]|nr:hypothetical protein [Planctomycetota bacterium]
HVGSELLGTSTAGRLCVRFGKAVVPEKVNIFETGVLQKNRLTAARFPVKYNPLPYRGLHFQPFMPKNRVGTNRLRQSQAFLF